MLKHGGDIFGYKQEFHREAIDFSANISPLGLPKSVLIAATNSLATANLYPDPLCRELTEAISRAENVKEDYILPSNGAADLIYRTVFASKPTLSIMLAPSFSEYADAVNAYGGKIFYHNLKEEEDFTLNEDILVLLQKKKPNLLFLCNPNNPTGQVIKKELLIKILEVAKSVNTRVLLDECFIDFLSEENYVTLKSELEKYKNLIILKAFTKIYAMAGLRLGYVLCADKNFILRLRESGQPWAVSTVAQQSGISALSEIEYLKTLKSLIAVERDFLKREFSALGIRAIGSEANFLFFKAPISSFYQELLSRGILLRNCDNFKSLPKGYLRCAVKTKEENAILLKEIQTIMRVETPSI